MVPATITSRTAHMAELIAGFTPRPKGTQTNRSRAEAEFKQIQKNKQDLSDNEKAKQAEREKTAQLKALRLAKEARLEAIHLAKKAMKK